MVSTYRTPRSCRGLTCWSRVTLSPPYMTTFTWFSANPVPLTWPGTRSILPMSHTPSVMPHWNDPSVPHVYTAVCTKPAQTIVGNIANQLLLPDSSSRLMHIHIILYLIVDLSIVIYELTLPPGMSTPCILKIVLQ